MHKNGMLNRDCIVVDHPEEDRNLRYYKAHETFVILPTECRSLVYAIKFRCSGRILEPLWDISVNHDRARQELLRCVMMLRTFDELRTLRIDLDVVELL
jgi:hypothetical protein